MGDRIVIRLTDGQNFTPDFYGRWCGLRAIKIVNDLARGRTNGINNLLCRLVAEIMSSTPYKHSYFLYNHGEAEGAADWNNYTWVYHEDIASWTTTHPDLTGRTLTIDEVDEIIREICPILNEEAEE